MNYRGKKAGRRSVHCHVCQLSKQVDAYTGTSISPSEPNIIHVLINPRASFMSAATYLTQRDGLVITLAELVPRVFRSVLGSENVSGKVPASQQPITDPDPPDEDRAEG